MIDSDDRTTSPSPTETAACPQSLAPEPRAGRGGAPALSRREFLIGAGLALAGAAGLAPEARAVAPQGGGLPSRPNILIIITDQERLPRHWPAGWADANLPHRKRLADTGLSFTNAHCSSAMCSPSRTSLFTGLYPPQHGVEHTLSVAGKGILPELSTEVQNMARMLASAGYNVQYRGKWHMSLGETGHSPTSEQVAAYGFGGWVPPDAGENTDPEGFGGGVADNDGRFAQQAADFLAGQTPASTAAQPFALIVSFVNPHDVLAYPRTVDDDANYTADGAKYSQGIEWTDIPAASRGEDLAANGKPSAQVQTLPYLAVGLGPLLPPPSQDRRNYLNFYAYLHKVVDEHIGTVLDALEGQGLREGTVIIRTADHGEMGLAHGGLRQKMFNAYQETLNIPLVFSNPVLFPTPRTTGALASLVDIMPTLASLANVPDPAAYTFSGRDLSPVLADAAAAVQDRILFTFDDEYAGADPTQDHPVDQPKHIRCILDGRWKYARYFDPSGAAPDQEELYDLLTDPDEVTNLAQTETAKRDEMAAKLRQLELDRAGRHVNLPTVLGGT